MLYMAICRASLIWLHTWSRRHYMCSMLYMGIIYLVDTIYPIDPIDPINAIDPHVKLLGFDWLCLVR